MSSAPSTRCRHLDAIDAAPCHAGPVRPKPRHDQRAAVRLQDGARRERVTTWKRRGTSEARHCIDYVLCSPEVGVSGLIAPDDDAVVEEELPGWNYPSDPSLYSGPRVPSPLISISSSPAQER